MSDKHVGECAHDLCQRDALPGHALCRKHLDAFARGVRGEELRDVKRKAHR